MLSERFQILFIVLIIGGIVINTTYLLVKFAPGDDYAIYTYFAEALLNGENPYNLSDAHRSEIVPQLISVGSSTQPIEGVVPQHYADYPPLLMLLNAFMVQLHPQKGLYYFYIALFGLSFFLFAVYVYRQRLAQPAQKVIPILFVLFMGFNPVMNATWFFPITDKVIFAVLILSLLLVLDRPYIFTIVCALFAAIKGLGIPIFFFYILYNIVNRKITLKQLAVMASVFAIILLLSHLPFFPEGMNGYQWRAERQSSVGHSSLFLYLRGLDLNFAGLGTLLTLASYVFLGIGVIRKRVDNRAVIVLPVVISIIFNTEPSYDRILVALFAMLVVVRNPWVHLVSYLMGILVTLADNYVYSSVFPLQFSSWVIIWGWLLYVLYAYLNENLGKYHY